MFPKLQGLRFSALFLVAASLAFYGWTAVDGIGWLFGYILLVYLLGRIVGCFKFGVGGDFAILEGGSISGQIVHIIRWKPKTERTMFGE